ncbi:hypothetical protein G6O69_09905 [Pseudenhygromyxa sp. WMMC2535]|uniref:metallopeptidase TldD-related protein n=1 Tax=Pseudenhygromyxa sp. WMMC2535 TaxID=2712867 RepID=UPI0015529AB1|nr:metallopeptidase TldD-related protein [Pseudenhygromyxa sp. WMMC2535]NVB38146.1 hypothetical protein [Pseudenhygromyxa sp. WMMC2535]
MTTTKMTTTSHISGDRDPGQRDPGQRDVAQRDAAQRDVAQRDAAQPLGAGLGRRRFLAGASVAIGALVGELLPGGPFGVAQAASGGELEALRAELSRGLAELRLPDAPEPYAATLHAVRAESLTIDGSYGGVIVDLRASEAVASVAVWVGELAEDNSNFFGGNIEPSFALPLLLDGDAARKRLWLAMDASFRAATAAYQAKLSAIDRLADKDLPDDRVAGPGPVLDLEWAPELEPGAALVDPPAAALLELEFDREGLRSLAASLSKRFEAHPSIDNGDVLISTMRSQEMLVSSEDLAMGRVHDRFVLGVVAQTQAEDGMELDHGLAIHAQELLAAEGLRERAEAMVDQVLRELEALVAAPMLDDDYDGPVLLWPTAAAQLLASTVAVHASGEPAPLSDYGRLLELEPYWQERLGKAVMPDFLDLVDDPLAEGFGHYIRDGEGVPAERVEIVRAGVLHSLLMTRRPNEKQSGSNGHARATAGGFIGPMISNLTLSSKKRGLSQDKLEAELLRRAREDGYEFAFAIESLRDGSVLGPVPRDSAAVFTSGRKISLPLPGRVFRLERKAGKIERSLVRGAMFAPMAMRALRRIRAVGDQAQTLAMRLAPGLSGGFAADLGLDGMLGQTVDAAVTCPALLMDGLELLVERGENERLPILEHPLRRG